MEGHTEDRMEDHPEDRAEDSTADIAEDRTDIVHHLHRRQDSDIVRRPLVRLTGTQAV